MWWLLMISDDRSAPGQIINILICDQLKMMFKSTLTCDKLKIMFKSTLTCDQLKIMLKSTLICDQLKIMLNSTLICDQLKWRQSSSWGCDCALVGEFEIQLDQLKIVKSVKQAVTGHWGKQVGHVAPEIWNDQYWVNKGYRLFSILPKIK